MDSALVVAENWTEIAELEVGTLQEMLEFGHREEAGLLGDPKVKPQEKHVDVAEVPGSVVMLSETQQGEDQENHLSQKKELW